MHLLSKSIYWGCVDTQYIHSPCCEQCKTHPRAFFPFKAIHHFTSTPVAFSPPHISPPNKRIRGFYCPQVTYIETLYIIFVPPLAQFTSPTHNPELNFCSLESCCRAPQSCGHISHTYPTHFHVSVDISLQPNQNHWFTHNGSGQ
jgi:hypothetical protein